MKKILTLFIITLSLLLLTSCNIFNNDKYYKVTFDSNGGSAISDIKVLENNKIDEPSEPEKNGYVFEYWVLDDLKFDFNTLINKNIELIAKWRKEKIYTVSFDSNGGNIISDIDVVENNQIDEPNDPKKEGYIFKGWYLNDELFDFDTLINKDIKLVSKWEKEEVYFTVSFNSDGGTIIKDEKVLKKDTVYKPNNPKKEGYVFEYWMLNDEEYDFNDLVENDIELKAKWRKEDVLYNISFNSNGGSKVSDVKVVENDKLDKPNNPKKDGFVFKGWYLDDELFDFDTLINKDYTLKAKWEEKSDDLDLGEWFE